MTMATRVYSRSESAVDSALKTSTRETVLILGASSSIARWTAHAFARRGYDVILAGRDDEDLTRLASDVRVRYNGSAHALHFDALCASSHAAAFRDALGLAGGAEHLAGLVLAFGLLDDQRRAAHDGELAANLVDVNFTAAVRMLTVASDHFECRGRGFIVAVGSIAGDRGRQSNYVYGAAKAGLSVFMQGLRHRLAKCGITVLTVKPGFVDTQMTFGLPGLFLVAPPSVVGERIARAVEEKQSVLYVPAFWRIIMMIIRLLPQGIFHRTRL